MEGLVGGAGKIIGGAADIVAAPFKAVGTTVGGIVSAPFEGAKTLLVGKGQKDLDGIGGSNSSATFDAAMKKAIQS